MHQSSVSARAIVRRAGVPFTHLDDEMLAIDAQQGLLFSLNETAGRVWDAIADPISIAAVCARLAAEYEIDGATCEREVIALVEQLREARLAEIVSDAIAATVDHNQETS